ncbi:MAG TPA: endonuclease VII domain-containing protein, partial [Ktedonobacteraceae bacterium]|nr:endonuclease VII domain-containing protein [Ktedonobacteraceae bacterium]
LFVLCSLQSKIGDYTGQITEKEIEKKMKQYAHRSHRPWNKTCSFCNQPYLARGSQETATLCPSCRAWQQKEYTIGKITCSNCGSQQVEDFYPKDRHKLGGLICCKDCSNYTQREKYKDKGGKTEKRQHAEWVNHLKRVYRITEEAYWLLFQQQMGLCASCGCTETSVDPRTGTSLRLCVDHNHVTGEIRGLLCHGCNIALGYLQEDPRRIKCLLKYAKERCYPSPVTNKMLDTTQK